MRVKLTVCYPFYRHREMFERHLDCWLSWPRELRRQVEFIIVDDGSPQPLQVPLAAVNLRHYRVDVDIPWNYGAKNLAVSKAATEWIFISELDHMLRARDAEKLLARCDDQHDRVLTVDRKNYHPDADPRYTAKPHPATWLLTKTTFNTVGGFDEDFAGAYGHDDTYFVALLRNQGFRFEHDPDIVLANYSGNHTYADADLTGKVSKDTTRNTELLRLKLQTMFTPKLQLRFKWHFVGRMTSEET